MTEIYTKRFVLERDKYYRYLVVEYFRRNALGYGLILLIPIAGLFLNSLVLVVYGVVALVALALYRIYRLRQYTNDPDNQAIFLPRRFRISTSELEAQADDGSETKFRYTSIVRVAKAKDHYRLYITKHQFHYIPFSAFTMETDRLAFESILFEQKLLESKDGV